ncbi:MAG: hypothetical protein AB1Z63_10975 [Candidatus Limnocylindrales bacterium]
MTPSTAGRTTIASLGAAILLLAAVFASGLAQDQEHPVVGRWTITSDAGGAVWAFLPSGKLVVTGPGEISANGRWRPASGPGELDASVEVTITGQELAVLGQVAAEGTGLALYVTATEATRPDDWHPWPAESRLVGQPFGMMVEETPEPTPAPVECLRPLWVDGAVDWDRCDEAPPA